jgi:hypothetical protein
MSDDLLIGSIDEISEQAKQIVAAIAPDAWCEVQDWDDRIDCMILLPDGSMIGEMVGLSEATALRFREAAERLLKWQRGIAVPLQDELRPPIFLFKGPDVSKPD